MTTRPNSWRGGSPSSRQPGRERVLVALHLVHPRAALELEPEVVVAPRAASLEVGGDQRQVAARRARLAAGAGTARR